MAAQKRSKEGSARRFVAALASLDDVIAVGLFGSVARGDSTGASDIDVLVLGSDPAMSPRRLLKQLEPDSVPERASLLYYTPDELRRLFRADSGFAMHLKLEARIAYDNRGVLGRILRQPVHPERSVDREIRSLLRQLSIYQDPEPFRDDYLFAFARLYSIGRAVVTARLLEEGFPEFSVNRSFARFKAIHPELTKDAESVEQLRPFYGLVARRQREQLPFPYRGSTEQLRQSVRAIEHLAASER